jgi:transposase-like protein
MNEPKTLREAIQYFSNAENCRQFMVSVLWPDGAVKCPICGSDKVSYLENAKLYFCKVKHPRQKFSLKVGTIFEDSHIRLEKWLPAFWLLVNCKNGISSYELARAVGVTQKSGWFMLHRIREALKNESFAKMQGGPVEVDETFVGGKVKNMHASKRPKGGGSTGKLSGSQGKAIVMGMLDPAGLRQGYPERGTRDLAERNPRLHRKEEVHRIHRQVGWISQP